MGCRTLPKTQTISLSVGADRIPVTYGSREHCCCSTGLKDAIAGSTVSSVKGMDSFEKMVHYSDPVVTVAIEAKHMKDLPKLVEVLRTVAKADPSIQVQINKETGEHLLSGMGELHLEITQYRIVNDHKVEIKSSPPIVVYRECVRDKSGRSRESPPTSITGSLSRLNRLNLRSLKLSRAETSGRREDKGL